MMAQKKLVPKRRFEGFNDEWNSKKMKELAKFSKGKGYSKRDLVPFGSPIILYGHLYTDYKSYIETVKTYAVKKENSVISQGNEIIVPSSGETAEDIARASTVGISGIILAGDLNIIKPNSTVDSLFLGLSISNSNLQKELIKRVQGSSVVHLYNSDIEEANLSYPTLKEQQKIGQFFKHFDEMIALQQRKLDKTKALKSAYLAEMFPAEGQRVPKRRFEGFTGEWEEYKLSDLAEISTGKAFSSIDFDDKGKYYVVTNKNIQDQSISIESVGSRINISEKLVLDNYVLRGNNILITMDGNVGRVGKYSDDNAVLAQRVARLNSKQFEFVYQITRKSQFISKMNEVSVGNIIKHISLKQISDYLFMAPKDKKEQEKIGNLLKNIDDIIITDQQKLEKLKSIKKAYLHEMFV